MQTKKMSLATIQGKLSRIEMKNIMAGSGSGSGCPTYCAGGGTCSWKSVGCVCSTGGLCT